MSKDIEQIIAQSADPELGAKQRARFEKAYHDAAGKPFDWKAEDACGFARLFGNTHALVERLLGHPLWADELVDSPYFKKRKPAKLLESVLAARIDAAAPHGDEDAFMHALRDFRHKEMIRVFMRDLCGGTEVKELLEEWSDCADAIVEAAWQRAHETMVAKKGIPMTVGPDGKPVECTGTVIALGKLGGRELNMSSDIDLIIIYSSDEGGALQKGAHVTNHEFFVAQTALFTKLVAHNTDHGFAFRVDHELRPEGPQGPLANSVDGAERYYEYFGHDWERQALIRARAVAGDMKLGEKFIKAIRPFVYRRSIALTDLAHMREMKRKMERKAERKNEEYDIKIGGGGIREVEFLSQAICLLFGAQMKGVCHGNTFEAIDALADAAIIHPFGAERLKSAYSFLRRTENMLQTADDLQVQKLPREPKELAALARKMGFADSEKMLAELTRHRQGVMRLFEALFEADYERLELVDAIRDNAARATNEEEEVESLAWFKKQEVRRIRQRDLAGQMPLMRILRRLTLTAEAVLAFTFDVSAKHLEEKFGKPKLENGAPAGFAIIGMGSLGANELDYGSDLDLCFIYAGGGSTDGKNSITNIEYFTKLAQRIISTMSMQGRYGRAYKVDSELRPSGQAGTLVASLDSFRDYHAGEAQVWERFSLMRARVITGNEEFVTVVKDELARLAFKEPPPPAAEVKSNIVHLRERTIEERVSVKPDVFNLKIGHGGLADIESIVQSIQLQNAPGHRDLWRQNAFEVMSALYEAGLIDPELHQELADHYMFLRRLLSRLRLAIERATDEINVDAWYAETLAFQMGLASESELALDIERRLAEVVGLFEREIGS